MKRKRDAIYHEVIAEIKRLGGTIDGVRQGNGSHRIIYWSLEGRRFHNTIARVNGSFRQKHNAMREVSGKLRGIR